MNQLLKNDLPRRQSEVPSCYYSMLKKNLPIDIIDSKTTAQNYKLKIFTVSFRF